MDDESKNLEGFTEIRSRAVRWVIELVGLCTSTVSLATSDDAGRAIPYATGSALLF
jgi:hypothetical protein